MKYAHLGNCGLIVSRICLGMMSFGDRAWRAWMLDEDDAKSIVQHAVEAGVIFFDTADVYSDGVSEQITGRLLRTFFVGRDDYVLATKLNSPTGTGPNDRGLSRKHIMSAVDASLRRLGVDYIDLYQIHRFDSATPVEETMQALDDVVRAGKVRYVGASSMFAWQFAKAQYTSDAHGWTRFVSMQNHYNLLYREEEREMIPLCVDQGVGVLPWSPLARGRLARVGTETRRLRHDDFGDQLYADAEPAIIDRLRDIAKTYGRSPAQVALAWLLSRPAVTAPIIGATAPQHVDDAVSALDVDLAGSDVVALEQPYRPQTIKGHS